MEILVSRICSPHFSKQGVMPTFVCPCTLAVSRVFHFVQVLWFTCAFFWRSYANMECQISGGLWLSCPPSKHVIVCHGIFRCMLTLACSVVQESCKEV